MIQSFASHTIIGATAAILASGATYLAIAGEPPQPVSSAVATPTSHEAAPSSYTITPSRQTLLFETTMSDVLGRVVSLRELERDPATESGAHRHPGSHTVGYVLEGTYEVQIDDGPVQRLGPGDTFYEQPNALHAVSRNGSTTDRNRILVFQVSDPSVPATVQEAP